MAKEKYQKNRHVRKGPRSFPYGSYPLSCAAFLPGAKRLYARVLHGSPAVRNLGGAPSPRDRPVRGDVREIFSFFSAFRARSARTALRCSCGVSGVPDLPRNQTPSPLRWRRGRAATEGFLREAAPPLSGALLVLFSRQGEKSTRIILSDKLQFVHFAHTFPRPARKNSHFHKITKISFLPLDKFPVLEYNIAS